MNATTNATATRTLTTTNGKSVVTDLTDIQAVELLRQHTGEFARKLVADLNKWRRLTANQLVWAHVLALELRDGRPARPATQVASDAAMKTIAEMFNKAAGHLKFPKVRLQTASGQKVVLSRCGERSKTPGAINVTDGRKFGENLWFGRIGNDGAFQSGRAATPEVVELLKKFAEAPAETAKRLGQLTGNCVFCGRDLSRKDSVHNGFGKICSVHYGVEYKACPDSDEEDAPRYDDDPTEMYGSEEEFNGAEMAEVNAVRGAYQTTLAF